MNNKIVKFLFARLSEKSTWATLLTVASVVAGIEFSPEQQEKIMLAGLAILGVIGVFVNENKSEE
jgi:hypothetical protein